MAMNHTPVANRIHIGFFGRRNAGKSSLVNAVTGQELSVVSGTPGTTTDPVYKTMELLPLGPVMIIDTPGMDDEGALGELRVKKTRQVLNKVDIAILVVDGTQKLRPVDYELVALFKEKELPYLIVFNKIDLMGETYCLEDILPGLTAGAEERIIQACNAEAKTEKLDVSMVAQLRRMITEHLIPVSAVKKQGIEELKERIAHAVKLEDSRFRIVGDLLKPLDTVILVVPIDSSAPKGRLILPQQQVIRDILEAGAISVVVKDTELSDAFSKLQIPPKLVITDSQVFGFVSKVVPEQVSLTSFSILMARWKGFLETAVKGVGTLEHMKEGTRILIAEGCTHHRQCEDIGTVKLPVWIRNYTGVEPEFVFCSGGEYPEDLSSFDLIIHCGACMLNEREVRFRMKCAIDQGIPFTNYGTAIAHMNGILARSVEMLPEVKKLLK